MEKNGYRSDFMLCYCKKCGRIAQEEYNSNKQICDYCNNIMQYIPKQFLIGKRGIALKKDLEQQFIDEYIKSSPEFDQYLFDHRDQDLFNRRMEDKAKLEHGKTILEERSRVPKCLTCGSANIKRISVTTQIAGVVAFGLFSKTARSQFQCENCGYKW